MTRTRKLTLKEFSHLVSESLDILNANPPPPSQSLLDNTAPSQTTQKTHVRLSSFRRIFSRPTFTAPHGSPLDPPDSPRKMIAWAFSRPPKKDHPCKGVDNAIEAVDPGAHRSLSQHSAAASTSSLGSLLPAHERLFHVTSRGSDDSGQNCHAFKVSSASSATVTSLHASEALTTSDCAAATSSDAIFGNESTPGILATGISSSRGSTRGSSERTEVSHSMADSKSECCDELIPGGLSLAPRATLHPAPVLDGSSLVQRRRPRHLSVAVPSRNADVFSLRPAVGAAPHVPSETDSSVSVCSTSSPTSPVARSSSPMFLTARPSDSGTSSHVPPATPPNARMSATLPGVASPSNQESVLPLSLSPRQRKRALSRSQTPPPLPRPPPTGPLPAVPSVPPVPPLPPFLSKVNMSPPHPAISSPPRPSIPTTALPPSPPGGLRLPSRLSWVNTVRAVLPSPPASPTKSLKTLAGKTSLPISPSKAEIKRPNALKRPTSIGVIEAADNIQVRRTKSILLLGSRSKSNASLGMKRVQIHADVNLEAVSTSKPRRKSSAAIVGHPTITSSSFGPVIASTQSSELLVPRERRHSAPVLSSLDSKTSADWTLSLPFCTDTPGNKILPSSLLTPPCQPEDKVEEVQGEDWTLCMPLKVRVGTPTVDIAEGPDGECMPADTTEAEEMVEMRPTAVQLPTPSPSPTWRTPNSVIQPLDPEESSELSSPVERPGSPASLRSHVGGCGQRASGQHACGRFDEVSLPEEDWEINASTAVATPDCDKMVKSHVAAFRKAHDVNGRHPSQDSMSTMSTAATFYSARSSVSVN